MKGIQVLPLRPMGLPKSSPTLSLRARRNYGNSRRRQAPIGIRSRWSGTRYHWHRRARDKGDKIGAIYTFLDRQRNSQVRTLSLDLSSPTLDHLSVLNHSAHFFQNSDCDKMRFAWPKVACRRSSDWPVPPERCFAVKAVQRSSLALNYMYSRCSDRAGRDTHCDSSIPRRSLRRQERIQSFSLNSQCVSLPCAVRHRKYISSAPQR